MNISARIYDELKFIARKREHAFNLYSIFLNVFESKVIKFWWIRSNNISELLFGGPNILEFSDSSKVINPGSVLQLSFWGYSVRNKNWFFIYILHYYAIICVTDYFWFSAKYLIEHCHTAATLPTSERVISGITKSKLFLLSAPAGIFICTQHRWSRTRRAAVRALSRGGRGFLCALFLGFFIQSRLSWAYNFF